MDSHEELLINEWLSYLKDYNYILDFNKNETDIIQITPKVEQYTKKCSILLREWTYKYDFKIQWNYTAYNLFYTNLNDLNKCYFLANNNVSLIDVKGDYTRRNRVTDITFPLVQKALYNFYGIYVQKVVPIKLFEKLFATDRYLQEDNIYKVGIKKGTNKLELKSYNKFINETK